MALAILVTLNIVAARVQIFHIPKLFLEAVNYNTGAQNEKRKYIWNISPHSILLVVTDAYMKSLFPQSGLVFRH